MADPVTVDTTFGVLRRSVFNSSVMDLPLSTRLLFIYLTADASREHEVWLTRSAMARRYNIPRDDVELGLSQLTSPDENAPDQPFEGRRIERLERDGREGWFILNRARYSTTPIDLVRAKERDRKRRSRESQKSRDTVTIGPVKNLNVITKEG